MGNLDEFLLTEDNDELQGANMAPVPAVSQGQPDPVVTAPSTPSNRQLAASMQTLQANQQQSDQTLAEIHRSLKQLLLQSGDQDASVTTTVAVPNVSSAPSSSAATLSTATTLVSSAHYATKFNVPKLLEDTTLDNYLLQIEIWKDSCGADPSKQAMMLMYELPQKDQYGGLQAIVANHFQSNNYSELRSPAGVDYFVAHLKKILRKQSWTRLVEWRQEVKQFKMKKNWTIE